MITAKKEVLEKYGKSIQWQIDHILPAWILENMDIVIEEMSSNFARFHLKDNPKLFRRFPPPRNETYLCGQAIMALADTLLVFAILPDVGHGKEMATLDATTHFLSPVLSGGGISIEAKVLKMGRRAIRGVVDIFDANKKLCATSIITYVYV